MIRFSLLGIPIKLNPSFFIAQTAIGAWIVFRFPATGVVRAIVLGLVVCLVLVSVLVHEMGHALEARRAGAAPSVTLVWFGGVTRYIPTMSTGRRLWIAAAGVAYQLVVAGAVWLALQQGWFDGLHPAVETTARVFVFYNILLGAVNLVPLGGMDGGAILEGILELIGVPRPKTVLLWIYVVGGVGLALWGFSNANAPVGIAGAYLTYAGFRAQTRSVRVERDAVSNPEVEQRVRQLLIAGRADEVVAIARDIYEGANSPEYRLYGASILALALRVNGDLEALADLLPTLEGTAVSPAELAAGYDAIERPTDAVRVLEPTVLRDRDPGLMEYLAALYMKSGRPHEAAQLIIANLASLRPNVALDIHRQLVESDAMIDAEAVRHALSAGRDTTPGHLAQMLLAEGEPDRAIALLRRDYELGATGSAAGWLGWALLAVGRDAEGSPLLAEALEKGLDHDNFLWIQVLLHRASRYTLATDFGEAALASRPPPTFANLLAYNLACSLTRLGRHEEAVAHLMNADVDLLITHMPTDDDLADLRGHPGFADLLSRFEPVGA